MPQRAAILDIGCAVGGVVEYFNELGHESVGIDLDRYISAILQPGEAISVNSKINYSEDMLQFLLHLEKHRLELLKGIYNLSDLK